MKRLVSLLSLGRLNYPVVALGVFDGVHIGHRKVITGAVRRARTIGGTSIAVTFWPHPQKEETLHSLAHRLRILGHLGVDVCVVLPFTRSLAKMQPEAFVKKVIVGKLHAKEVFVGDNFRFGKNAAGGVPLLKKLGRLHAFRVKAVVPVSYRGRRVSSTAIRALISKGDLAHASMLLGRRVSLFGTVVRGTSLAGRLGFPTANIIPHHEVMPPPGIYAVRTVVGKRSIGGVCYIGTRPTFSLQKAQRQRFARHVEVHLFGFHADLYGREIEVFFLRRIRPEKKFSSVAALVSAVHSDMAKARRLISSR